MLVEEREIDIRKARELYIKTGLTNNITEAYEMFREHNDVKHPAVITRYDKEYQYKEFIKEENRPKCPECGTPMGLWEVNNHPKNMVGGNYKTQWICMDENACGYQGEYSELNLEEQIKERKKIEQNDKR